jgi:hypothetical protein
VREADALALRAYANERKLKNIGRGGWAMVDSNGPGRRRGVASFFVSWLGEHHAFRLAEATRVWSSHTLMACVFILGIWLVEKFTYLLWGRELPLLFGWFPLQYIFHAADAGVLVVFLLYGGYKAMRAYMGEGR